MKKVICSVVLAFQVGLSLQASDGVGKGFFKDRRVVAASGALVVGAIGWLGYIAWNGYKFSQGLQQTCEGYADLVDQTSSKQTAKDSEEMIAKPLAKRPALRHIVAGKDIPGSEVVQPGGALSPIPERPVARASSPVAAERGLARADHTDGEVGGASPMHRVRTGSFGQDFPSAFTVVGAAGPIINPACAASRQ